MLSGFLSAQNRITRNMDTCAIIILNVNVLTNL